MYGVSTDANGLYYMRARYYNVSIKRFINQDIVNGSITNSQSLNKYSYVQGNPISLTDPFGLSPNISISGIGHAALDLLGIIPGFDFCDAINTAWYLSEGDYENAALSAVACIPMLGSVVGNGLKWGAKGVANAEKVADTVKLGSRIVGDGGAMLLSGGQAVESAKQVYTNITNSEGLTWKNAVDVITLGISVAGMGMAGASIAKSGKSLKAMYKGETAVSNVATSNATKGVSQTGENARQMKMDLQLFGGKSSSESNYILFNKTHKNSLPKPKGTGPNGGRLQSHHGLQQQWAIDNLSKYGYDPDLAPTITIETGKGMPHTIISNLQNARRDARVASGNGKWSSSLQDELSYIVSDFRAAGFSDSTINIVLEQQYKMLDKLGVPYERIKY